jgi:hypothetical protein
MSSTVPHLAVCSLAGIEGIEKILEDLGNDLYNASFAKADLGMEKCVDDKLHIWTQPLFAVIGFAAEVSPQRFIGGIKLMAVRVTSEQRIDFTTYSEFEESQKSL